jgi:hypothetical protein
LERSPCCPTCLSKYEDVHGPCGATDPRRCEDIWHRGSQYDPNKLDLSDEDMEFLKDLRVTL